jgi:serine/threonine protein kinase
MIKRGAYGCVLKPSISCKNKVINQEKTVSKVFEIEDYYEEELAIYEIMKIIDPERKYTLSKLDECSLSKIPKEAILKCKYKFSEFPKKQIIYEYGGIDLSELIKTNYDIKSLMPGIINIVDGLISLDNAGYCHRDIKETNIVFKNNKFYLIDFGLLIKFDNLYDEDQDYVLRFNYCYYPPEFKIYYNYKLTQTNITSIYDLKKFTVADVKLNYTKSLYVYDDEVITKSVSKVLDFMKNIDIVKVTMTQSANKVDIFGFGMVLIKLITNANSNSELLKLQLLKISEKCIEINSWFRYSPKKLKKELLKLNY